MIVLVVSNGNKRLWKVGTIWIFTSCRGVGDRRTSCRSVGVSGNCSRALTSMCTWLLR